MQSLKDIEGRHEVTNNLEVSENKPMIYSYKSLVDAGTFVRLRSDIQL